MKADVYRVRVDFDKIGKKVEGNEALYLALRDIEWSPPRGMNGHEYIESGPLNEGKASEVAGLSGGVVVADPQEWSLLWTKAPKSYDGFDTFTVSNGAAWRKVAVRNQYFEWQSGRYSSGLHGALKEPPEHWKEVPDGSGPE